MLPLQTKRSKLLPYLVVLLGLVVLVVVIQRLSAHRAAVKVSPTLVAGNSTYDDPNAKSPVAGSSTSPTASSSVAPSPTAMPPIKPILAKSSGNAPGSSVPAGAVIEFTCEGSLNAQCSIILTNQSNSSNSITLPAKAIIDNGRGQYFAIWDWTAVNGSWTVLAHSTNAAGAANSDIQTLMVR